MNHLLCSRCGAALEHLNALLGHYQEVHGGVPKPRFFSADDCDTSATVTPGIATQRRQELFRRISELIDSEVEMWHTEDATRTSEWSESVPSSTIRNRPLSTPQSTCRNALHMAERGPVRGMD